MTNPAVAKTGESSATSSGINLRQLLEEMIERDASDLHVTAGERPKLRIDGDITNSRVEHVLNPKDTLQLAYSVLTENQKKRFETEDELDFSFGIQNLARFRGNCFKQRGCVSMVIRQIPFSVKTFDQLGLAPIISQLSDRPRGLVLVTGPTGSGKSTTLAAMIDKVNRELKGHILTVEEPIEFIDLTDLINAHLAAHKVESGLATIFSRHTTAAIKINEAEELLLEDFRTMLRRMCPPGGRYHHNDMSRRKPPIAPDERPNAHSHLMHLLLSTS